MSACNTNTALLRYRMRANLSYPPFQIVTWYSPNVPDFVGTLSGYAPDLLLNIAIDGQPVSLSSPVQYNEPTGPASGDLVGCYPAPTVVGIDGIPINPTETPLNGQGLIYNATDGYLEWVTGAGESFVAGGDLSGTYLNQKVIGIDGYVISGSPTNQQALVYNGISYVPTSIAEVFNVKSYGAKGDGVTNDTTAILAAAAAFQAAALTGTATELYFPAGTYLLYGSITLTGLYGGVIRGDGIGQSTIQQVYTETVTQPVVLGIITLTNCQLTTIEHLSIVPAQIYAFGGSSMSVGSTSFTGNFYFAGLPNIGQRVCIVPPAAPNGSNIADFVVIQSVSGTFPANSNTVTFSPPTLNAYPANCNMVTGALGGVISYSDKTLAGASSATNNRVDSVTVLSEGGYIGLSGFGTACKGGGPVLLTAIANSGQPVIHVTNAGLMYVGEILQFFDNYVSLSETKIIQSISGNQVTLTTNLGLTHQVTCFVANINDGNNDEHQFTNCFAENVTLCGYYLEGQNSLNVRLTNCDTGGLTYAHVYAAQGGSVNCIGSGVSLDGYAFVFGGMQQHSHYISGGGYEGGFSLLYSDPSWNTQSLVVHFISLDFKSFPTTTFNVTGDATLIDIIGCNIGGTNYNFTYANKYNFGTQSRVSIIGGYSVGSSGGGPINYNFNGVDLIELGVCNFGSIGAVENFTGGATITKIGRTGTSGSPQTTSIANSLALVPYFPNTNIWTLVNGLNNNLPALPNAVVILENGTLSAPFTITGIQQLVNAINGVLIKGFNLTGQVLTLSNQNTNSLADNRFITPTGADLVNVSCWEMIYSANATTPGWYIISYAIGSGTTILSSDSSSNAILNGASDVFLQVGGTTQATLNTTTLALASTAINFTTTSATSARLGWSSAGAGAGAQLNLFGQNATGSGNSGGSISLNSGLPGSGGSPGIIEFTAGSTFLGQFASTEVGFAVPVGGVPSANPLTFSSDGYVTITSPVTLTAAQYSNVVIPLNGNITGASTTITLPNTVGSFWLFDVSSLTWNNDSSIVFTTGSGTSVTVGQSNLVNTNKLLTVTIPLSNVVSVGG